MDPEDPLEKGPPYSSRAGAAVGGSPAQLRSAEGLSHRRNPDMDEESEGTGEPTEKTRIPPIVENCLRLRGFDAIEYAEKQGLTLHKHPDSISGPRVNVSVAEAAAIATEDPDLIWLDVSKDDYYSGAPSSYAPER